MHGWDLVCCSEQCECVLIISQRTSNWMFLGFFFFFLKTSTGRIICQVRNILKLSCFSPLSYWSNTLYGTMEINYFNPVLGAFFVIVHVFTFLHHFSSSGFLCKFNYFCLNGECFTTTSSEHPKRTQVLQHWKQPCACLIQCFFRLFPENLSSLSIAWVSFEQHLIAYIIRILVKI